MSKDNLPEEKLLKLIRVKKPDKDKQEARAFARPRKGLELKHILRFINIVLMVVALALAGFLLHQVFFSPDPSARVTLDFVSPSKSEPPQESGQGQEKKPYDYYNAQFLKRDLFERPLDQVAANASVDLTKRYKLVGIVLGDIPEAIIEDLTSRNTIFVHPGERLDGVEVKTIEEGRVVFLQEGLEIELKQ